MTDHTNSTIATTRPSFLSLAPEAWRMAENLARASMVPEAYRGSPANCFIALEMAHRLNISPMAVMQGVSVIKGKPFMAASFLIAQINASGIFASRLRFAAQLDPLQVTCSAVERDGTVVSTTITWEQAVRAGWPARNAKYNEMPEQMLQYRAATFFARIHCPEIMFGMHTDIEAEEFAPRVVPTEDPLDRVLSPKTEPEPEPEPQLVPETAPGAVSRARVEKLLRAFAGVGLGADYVEARYGPLDEMTEESYAEAVADGKARRDAGEAPQPPPAAPRAELFEGADTPAPDYD